MSQHLNSSSSSSAPQVEATFPPIPLLSGNTLLDTNGRTSKVSGVRVLVTTEGSTEPTEIVLEEKFGGWWAPTLKFTANTVVSAATGPAEQR